MPAHRFWWLRSASGISCSLSRRSILFPLPAVRANPRSRGSAYPPLQNRGRPFMSLPVHERLSQIAALFLGFGLVPAAAQAQIAFESHQVGQSPQAMDIVAHADFNNDGREDLMVLNFGTTSSGLLYLS